MNIAYIEKILANKLRVDILLQVIVHGELTLSEITQMMRKSKSAMSRQMKKLVKFDMIEEFEQDLNNPGSPHKAYRVSQAFIESFIGVRDKKQFFKKPDVDDYISYMMGMLAVSNRLADLTKNFLVLLEKDYTDEDVRGKFVDMGILFTSSQNTPAVQTLLQKFIYDVQNLPKSKDNTSDQLISIGIHPFQDLLSLTP